VFSASQSDTLASMNGLQCLIQGVLYNESKDSSAAEKVRDFKASVYYSIIIVRLHGSKAWPVRTKNELPLSRAEMKMVRQMCGVKLSDKVACVGLRERLDVEDIVTVLQCNRLP